MLESTKVPALTRAIEILNLIGRIGPCSAATIIAELGIPKSTVYLLLGELKKQRFISMDNQDNYCLWTKLVELAGQALSKMDLRELARPRLTRQPAPLTTFVSPAPFWFVGLLNFHHHPRRYARRAPATAGAGSPPPARCPAGLG